MLIHIQLVLIPLLLVAAALFAASEVSLLSLSRAQLETLHTSKPHIYRRIRALVFKPDALLSTLIIGNECINITLCTLVTEYVDLLLLGYPTTFKVISSVLTSCLLLLMISEILPKILAFRMPLSFASFLVFPMTLAHFLLTPLRVLFQGLASQILQWFGIKVSGPTALTEQDFLTLVEVGAESGTLDRDEKEMIFSVFHFGDLTVSSVMTPWEKVQWIKETVSPNDILELARKTRLSRFPVISSKGSEVVGILHTKELLPYLQNKDSIPSIKSIMFDPYIVSIHKKVSHLFREFKIKKIHMALIVDEFGRHRGVVTLEDLLSTLFRTQQKKGENP